MKKIALLFVLVFALSGCLKTTSPQNQNTNATIDLSANPKYCQNDADCIAVPTPGNMCYFGYFNKNATAAIEEHKNTRRAITQDCPQFSDVYCKDNQCTADSL